MRQTTATGGAARRGVVALLLLVLGAWLAPAEAADGKLHAVATFSILGDLVAQVGGEAVHVTSLVGPDADAHGYSPAPADARTLARADLVVANGLGFEGWITRLIRASGTRAPLVEASRGIRTITGHHDHEGGSGRDDHADPHAWQSIANVRVYVANIRDGLGKTDPARADAYRANATAYLAKLDQLEAEIRAAIAAIPTERRRVITTHDSFGYFGAAYGLSFVAPQGISTDSEASPSDVARIVRQIRRDRIPAVFLETVSDPRLMQQIARESGARIGGKVYSDALSGPDGPAPSYIEMMRSNLKAFREALG